MSKEIEQLKEYKEKLSQLSEEEKKKRNLYLRKLALGEIQGKMTGFASVDKPSLKFYPEDIEEKILKDADQKIYDFLRKRNEGYESEVAYSYFGESKSYGYLFEKIDLYAKALKKYGISEGDTVTICLPNMPETIFYTYACNRIGASPYLIDPRCSSKRIVDCMNTSNSKLLIALMDIVNKSVISKEIPADKIVIVSPSNDFKDSKKELGKTATFVKLLYDFKEKKFSFENTLLKNDKKIIMQDNFIKGLENYGKLKDSEYDPNIPSLIVNTSGTSGTPKGAMQSNIGYNTTCNQIKYIVPSLKRGLKYLGYIPFFSMYGSSIGMCGALTNGISIDILPKIKISEFDKIVIKEKPNIVIAVPKMFSLFKNSIKIKESDLSFLKLLVAGGDNMAPNKIKEINEILQKNGCTVGITYGYGATEAGNVAAFQYKGNELDLLTQKDGGCGAFYPGVYGKIVDRETGEEMPYNTEGEVFINSPTSFLGYIGNEKETNESIYIDPIDNSRYYKTADKGFIDENGVLTITGRYKRLMKRPDGHQVSSVPIENAIADCDIVKDCAVVGIKNRYQEDGVIPTAFIELNNRVNEIQKIEDIVNETKKTLPGEREMALAYVIVDKIPYTLGGKKDFTELSKNNFEDLENPVIIDDPVFDGYFTNGEKFVKINLNSKKYIKKR